MVSPFRVVYSSSVLDRIEGVFFLGQVSLVLPSRCGHPFGVGWPYGRLASIATKDLSTRLRARDYTSGFSLVQVVGSDYGRLFLQPILERGLL